MPKHREEERPDVYYIPPNYVDSSGVLGGMFRLRNAIEACVLGLAIGLPVNQMSVGFSATIRISILVCAVLPPMFFAAIGIMGLSLTEFIYFALRFLVRRRIVGKGAFQALAANEAEEEAQWSIDGRTGGTVAARQKAQKIAKKVKKRFDKEVDLSRKKKGRIARKHGSRHLRYVRTVSETAHFLPIKNIKNGIIHTTDGRYVKIIEVTPINFLLRSAKEQRSIIWAFASFLKIAPVKIQFKSLSKKADINRHIERAKEDLNKETNDFCRELQADYMNLLYEIGSKQAVSRRFFIIFEYEPYLRAKDLEADARSTLETVANSARTYLNQCGNDVIKYSDPDEATIEALYQILNRKSSFDVSLAERKRKIILDYAKTYGKSAIEDIPAVEFAAPKYIDISHINYIKMDGLYIAYLVIPSDGYKTTVHAGWASLLIDAGEGIDVDIFMKKEPKEKISQSLGRHIRMNKSKIKDASDTNDDFDALEGSITGGYYMKKALANSEDFYYVNVLVTVTGANKEILEWRVRELQKKMIATDMRVQYCSFRQEDAFLSSLPLASIEKGLHKWSRRNVVTSGAASCYPLTSFELCDDNGILLGVNKHNQSLIMVDIFNSSIYRNANISILGTSGAGKSFTLLLMATRMRRKGTQVFIVAPLKGHEFFRVCNSIGGSFIQISPSSKHCINVMEIRVEDTANSELIDEAVLEKSLLAAKIQRLHIFFSLLIPDMNYEEKQLLDESIVQTYHRLGIGHENESLINPETGAHKTMPTLGDLYAILINKPETKRLANIINRLVSGSASTFNQQTNVVLDNKFVVLDISELTGELLTIGMFVALDYVWDKAKEDRTKEKAIFIDETWKLIGASSNKLAAEFVLEIFKVIRGYGGAAICASQDLFDFFALEDGKYGKGIINNCKTKIILNLEDNEADLVQDTLGLSENERQAIVHFERGNAMISTNKNNVTVEVRASTKETELITTDRRELQAIADRRRAEKENEKLMKEAAAMAKKSGFA